MNFFERAAQSLLGGSSLSLTPNTLSASNSVISDVSSPARQSNTRSPTFNNSDTDDDVTDTEEDSGIADAHDLTARAKRFFPDLGIGNEAMLDFQSSRMVTTAPGGNTLNTFLTYW